MRHEKKTDNVSAVSSDTFFYTPETSNTKRKRIPDSNSAAPVADVTFVGRRKNMPHGVKKNGFLTIYLSAVSSSSPHLTGVGARHLPCHVRHGGVLSIDGRPLLLPRGCRDVSR